MTEKEQTLLKTSQNDTKEELNWRKITQNVPKGVQIWPETNQNELEQPETSQNYPKGDLNWSKQPKTTQKDVKGDLYILKTSQNVPNQPKMTQIKI